MTMGAPLNEADHDLLVRYPRAVMHMRQQLESERLGLVFGAGVSSAIGFPGWGELIERIAADSTVDGASLLEAKLATKTSRTQLLFERFRERWTVPTTETEDPYVVCPLQERLELMERGEMDDDYVSENTSSKIVA